MLEDIKNLEVDVVRPEDDADEMNLEQAAAEAPVVKLTNLILMDAIKRGASDIHFENYDRAFGSATAWMVLYEIITRRSSSTGPSSPASRSCPT